MSKNFSQRFYLSFFVSVSLFGLFLMTLSAFSQLRIQEDFQWRKPVVGSVYGLLCILGIIAVFFPSGCSTIFHADNGENTNHAVLTKRDISFQNTSIISGLKITHGHHPCCEAFTAHEFQIGKKTFCTACMGLLLGALVTLFGVTAYFFRGWNIGQNIALLHISGIVGIVLGLFQYMFFDFQWRLIRFLLNAFFIFGTFLVLAGTDAVANSLILDFFVIFLCVFWLLTRILLSKNIHDKICQTCSLKCEFYRK